MKTFYFSVLIIFLMGFLIFFLLSLMIREIPNDIQPSLEGTQMIYKDVVVKQFFTSEMDNLLGIGTSIKNPNFRNRKSLILNLYSDDQELLRTVTLNGLNIPDGDFIKIRFQPIKDSRGKKYLLQLSAPEASSEESLEIFLTSQNPKWMGNLQVNSNNSDGKMSFITYHKPMNFLTVYAGIFIQTIKRFFADLPFAFLYIFAICFLVCWLVYLKRKD